MSKGVVIKSNRYGISLILDEEMAFSEILESVKEQFQKNRDFFKNSKLAVSFRNRELSKEEQSAIIRVITENSSVQIVRILDEEAAAEPRKRTAEAGKTAPIFTLDPPVTHTNPVRSSAEETREPAIEANAEFYKGNLRSGQVLKCASHVTLVGDVNPGATIISTGSIMILGSLKGTACAGAGGDNSCFIYALEMNPLQLQIGNVIAKRPDKEKEKRVLFRKAKEENTANGAMVAAVSGETISLEPVSKEVLSKISM